ncbi:MAG: CapA family protein [Pseudomonadota bacterium]
MKKILASSRLFGYASAIVFATALTASNSAHSNWIPTVEQDAVTVFNQTPIAVRGQAVLPSGVPVAGVRLKIGEREVTSDLNGQFQLNGLSRRNALLEVTGPTTRTVLLPIHLVRPLAVTAVTLDPIILTLTDSSTVRFLFGGDTSFGRRFLDVDGLTPRNLFPADHPDALIQASNPLPGTRASFDFVRPLLKTADFFTVNLETPVTNKPATPHPTKDFAFFTIPASLTAMTEAGIKYVSLGNNHVFDYQELGITDTLRFVDAAGLSNSGAGKNSTEAFKPWRTTLRGSPYSFLAMTSVSGSEHDIIYVATSTKGGAADLRDSAAVKTAIETETQAGRFPIAILHAGQEYTYGPTPFALERMKLAASSGASLVIAHHPHVAQGFGRYNGVLTAHSLGNFAFDQDRIETMLGIMAQIDMKGKKIEHTEVIPLYLKDYRPRLVTGPLADRLMRRIGEDSRKGGVTLIPMNGRGFILNADEAARTEGRDISVQTTIPASGFAVIDLRGRLKSGESLALASTTTTGIRMMAGQDRLDYGDFEDQDIDNDSTSTEPARWDLGGAAYPCLRDPHLGALAVCSRRKNTDALDSIIALRNRVRVIGDSEDLPNKKLTLYGWMRGSNAGPIKIVSRYYASEGALEYGEEQPISHPGGQFGWQSFAADLSMPKDTNSAAGGEFNARAVRLFFRHSPPATDTGSVSFDDIAIINWDPTTAGSKLQLATPHSSDFIRVEGAPGAAVTVNIVVRRQRPAAVL